METNREEAVAGIIDAIGEISQEICWDNWENEEDSFPTGSGSDGYWKVSEVLTCRLEWLRDVVGELETIKQYQYSSFDEHRDTIDMVQDLLKAVAKLEK